MKDPLDPGTVRWPSEQLVTSHGAGPTFLRGWLYGVPDPEGAAWGHVVQRAGATKLAKLLTDEPTTFGYTYDMGDNWEHRIIVERLQAADPDTLYPVFLGGERRCPPEDCGSVPGYYDFLEAILGPDRARAAARSGRC